VRVVIVPSLSVAYIVMPLYTTKTKDADYSTYNLLNSYKQMFLIVRYSTIVLSYTKHQLRPISFIFAAKILYSGVCFFFFF